MRRRFWYTGGVHRHLVSVADLDAAEIVRILDRGDRYWALASEPVKKLTSLRGRTVINLFFEASTRTRTSFELAAKRLSAEAINISGAASSTTKGETLIDTAENLEAMHPDVIVVRHAFGGAAALLAQHVSCAVVNAGDGQHEHPTQALLDAATIRRAKGTSGSTPGDHVRGARGRDRRRHHALAGRALEHPVPRQARRRLVAPLTLIPRGIELIGGEVTRERVRIVSRLEDGLDGIDVVMMLRVQHERFEGEASRFPNTRELSRTFGLSERTLGFAKPDAIVMHPGPINRGVELAPQVADGPRAVILQQVSWGVAIRMAVLERAVIGFDGAAGVDRTGVGGGAVAAG